MSQLKLVIVGAGGISRAHIAAANATGGRIKIAAVVDPDPRARQMAAEAAAASPAPPVAGFADFGTFLASGAAEQVRGVIVCTPPSVRLAIVEASLQRGLAVLSEKPLAHTVAAAEKLAALASDHPHVVTAVGYCHRFTPAIVEMKRRIAAGEIGSISRFENTFAAPLAARMKQHWMSDPAISGGGSFIDTGCHSLDLFLHLIGDGEMLSAVFHNAWPGRGESSATALLRSRDGVAGVIQSGWSEPGRFIVSVVGTEGSLAYDYDDATVLRVRRNDGAAEAANVEPHDLRFQRQLEAFADAIESRQPSVVPASFDDGLWIARQVDAAQREVGRN